MSDARDKVERLIQDNVPAGYEASAVADLDAYRAEVLREGAELIESHEEFEIGGYGDGLLDASLMLREAAEGEAKP